MGVIYRLLLRRNNPNYSFLVVIKFPKPKVIEPGFLIQKKAAFSDSLSFILCLWIN